MYGQNSEDESLLIYELTDEGAVRKAEIYGSSSTDNTEYLFNYCFNSSSIRMVMQDRYARF